MTKDRRTNERIGINLRVRWAGNSGQQEARIGDIGLGGCFVDSMSRVTVGESLKLDVEMPSGEWISLPGHVTSCQEAVGFGLKFTSLTPQEESGLKKLLTGIQRP